MRISNIGTGPTSTGGSNNGIPSSASGSISFGVYSQESGVSHFLPVYYPERFTITTEKELQRVSSGCEGEKISVDKLKNSELHITGKVHTSDLSALDDISHSTQPVDVITPVIEGGGMECYITSCERGDVISYDAYPTAEEWMFEYTIDLVSIGTDEYGPQQPSHYEP